MLGGKKGANRIAKVVQAFSKQVEELTLGISEVESEIVDNKDRLARAEEIFKGVEKDVTSQNKSLDDSKARASTIKNNIEKLISSE